MAQSRPVSPIPDPERAPRVDSRADDAERELSRSLTRALEAAAGEPKAPLTWLSLEVPAFSSESLLTLAGEDAWFGSSGAERDCVGLGVARRLTSAGTERFARLDEQATRVFSELHVAPGSSGPPPRLVGGFAFASDGAASVPWTDFGACRLTLPRATYTREGSGAWFGLTATAAELGASESRRELAEAWARRLVSAAESGVSRESVEQRPLSLEGEDRATWRTRVEAARRAIQAGELEKVVLARSLAVRYERSLSLPRILARLRARSPAAPCFAVRYGESAFLGAPPERLFAKRGLELETEAIAGSASADASAAGELLGSKKILAEQQPVVDDLVSHLAPLMHLERVSPEPQVVSARGILHLKTAIRGVLKRPERALRLAGLLHPTPAVGGFPTQAALAWLYRHEALERGWYSGSVGWLDANGDSEFQVALRSGVIVGNTAYAYAGAGIVRDSNPDEEFDETALKLDVLLGTIQTSG